LMIPIIRGDNTSMRLARISGSCWRSNRVKLLTQDRRRRWERSSRCPVSAQVFVKRRDLVHASAALCPETHPRPWSPLSGSNKCNITRRTGDCHSGHVDHGDLYGNTLANLLLPGIAEDAALKAVPRPLTGWVL
jgi:hypothetical protein